MSRETTEPVRRACQAILTAGGDDSVAAATDELLSRVARKVLNAFDTSNTTYVSAGESVQAAVNAAVLAGIYSWHNPLTVIYNPLTTEDDCKRNVFTGEVQTTAGVDAVGIIVEAVPAPPVDEEERPAFDKSLLCLTIADGSKDVHERGALVNDCETKARWTKYSGNCVLTDILASASPSYVYRGTQSVQVYAGNDTVTGRFVDFTLLDGLAGTTIDITGATGLTGWLRADKDLSGLIKLSVQKNADSTWVESDTAIPTITAALAAGGVVYLPFSDAQRACGVIKGLGLYLPAGVSGGFTLYLDDIRVNWLNGLSCVDYAMNLGIPIADLVISSKSGSPVTTSTWKDEVDNCLTRGMEIISHSRNHGTGVLDTLTKVLTETLESKKDIENLTISVAVTASSATNRFTSVTPHQLAEYQWVTFATTAGNVVAGTPYLVRCINAYQFAVNAYPYPGATITLTTHSNVATVYPPPGIKVEGWIQPGTFKPAGWQAGDPTGDSYIDSLDKTRKMLGRAIQRFFKWSTASLPRPASRCNKHFETVRYIVGGLSVAAAPLEDCFIASEGFPPLVTNGSSFAAYKALIDAMAGWRDAGTAFVVSPTTFMLSRRNAPVAAPPAVVVNGDCALCDTAHITGFDYYVAQKWAGAVNTVVSAGTIVVGNAGNTDVGSVSYYLFDQVKHGRRYVCSLQAKGSGSAAFTVSIVHICREADWTTRSLQSRILYPVPGVEGVPGADFATIWFGFTVPVWAVMTYLIFTKVAGINGSITIDDLKMMEV